MIENKNKDFSIIGIYIHKDCKYKKVLKPGYYSLNDAYIYDEKNKKIEKNHNIKSLPDDFFGKNISISAIVGKNGSGKSSILDMIYRIINNFAFCYIKKEIHTLYKIKDLHADLYFVNGDSKYVISVNKEQCFIKVFSLENPDGAILKQNDIYEKIEEIIKNFFYTIVVNYSNHSLLPKDYEEESKPKDWLNNIFNKNDGYQTPIVLNPYKSYGILHLYNDIDLTIVRLQSILIKLNNEKEFIEGYKLEQIEYKILQPDIAYAFSNILRFLIEHHDNKINIKGTFSDFFKESTSVQDLRKCIKIFSNIGLTDENCKECIILKACDIDISTLKLYISNILEKTSDFYDDKYKISYILSCIYIIYKIQKIIELPIGKEKYKLILNKNWQEVVDEIRKNHSHVEFKIHQALNWILFIKKEMEKEYKKNKDTFLYTEIFKNINFKEKTLSEICELLPPSFFKQSIKLKRNDDSIVDFNELSSGEKQLIFNNTTIVYHILNILSVKENTDDMFSYRNINIVLDEIELYFHPEYQKKYISNLVDVFNRLDLNKQCKINIVLSTHSPFILSDIPKQNILFLEEGVPVHSDCKPVETFAANISDLLKDSFFLEEGFIGKFAAEKIKKIINDLNEKKEISSNVYGKYENIIELIGEPLIKYKLKDMLAIAFPKSELVKEIDRLKQELKEKERILQDRG